MKSRRNSEPTTFRWVPRKRGQEQKVRKNLNRLSMYELLIDEIQETIDPQDLSYIRSEHNPDDALTKGILSEQLENCLKDRHS